MIQGHKIIAFTPCGRKRYMDLLASHVMREHARGHIDQWVLFNNPYSIEDSTYADQLAAMLGWVRVIKIGDETPTRHAGQIATFYGGLDDAEAIYVRLDDDLIYLDEQCIPNLIKFRLEHPHPFIVYPTIINNTRTSFQLQKHGIIPQSWGEVEPILCAPTAWRNPDFVLKLHQKALTSIASGTLVEDFTLPSEEFTDLETGNISINSFAMFGKDMVECNVSPDEETYLSMTRQRETERMNARAGDAIVIHFAYHTQTEFMDKSGILTDYAWLTPPLPFRTVRLPPLSPAPVIIAGQPARVTQQQRQMFRSQNLAARQAAGLTA